ncbi:reverse transcriptase domain-containing protein, partial [Thiolapillus sp.]|uniref:reverse transcriptase domain-containing protein n=1 Tax=Thiolapillus sp. TaxID=2017437 RepID=UPI0025E6DA2D
MRNAFAKKEHVLAIFFDLEKAYDTTWKHGILSDLYDLDFRGHLPTFIDGFLSHQLFQVRAGPTLSDTYEQEMGVPQGSILSPVLFSLKINNIVKSVLKGSEASLFVDDFALCIPPLWGAADAEIKVPSGENTELKRFPFKAWSRSVYSHTCYTYCQGFLSCLF